jgi:hypothetical protein
MLICIRISLLRKVEALRAQEAVIGFADQFGLQVFVAGQPELSQCGSSLHHWANVVFGDIAAFPEGEEIPPSWKNISPLARRSGVFVFSAVQTFDIARTWRWQE